MRTMSAAGGTARPALGDSHRPAHAPLRILRWCHACDSGASASRRARIRLRHCKYRSVIRSRGRLIAAQKPNAVNGAVNIQLITSIAAIVRAKAARRASVGTGLAALGLGEASKS